MSQRMPRVLIAGVAVLGVAALGGCATKKFVNEQVGQVSTRVDSVSGQVSDVTAKVADHDTKLANLDQSTKDALERATAAGKLAEGKFLYSQVLQDDSMKFGVSKAALSPEAQARLDAFVDKLKSDNRNVYIEVQGHTDATGPKEVNYRLGEERAEAVRRYLNEHGVALNRIGTISYGADDPVAPNNKRDGRAQNRRVVLIVLA
ncbi:OmpA family protein [Phenylobacterium sp.]|uniref:OmpA family protein n=1 Tax=Phenylobacterium sp. TaxID=1871053 RepID=UPI0012168E47|nr:OmpA family protein [Phenylobacterium sp.]THD65919.1 MAG: OmpA family protein [Phenylobacterium sp.]